MSQKTLFLDFDGVFHDLEAAEEGRLFQWAPILSDILGDQDVSLVIHADGLTCSQDELQTFLPTELARRVTGVVRPGSKYFAILEYTRLNAIEDHRYRVIDDAFEDYQMGWPQLILCDSRRGLSDPVVQRKIAEFLNL